VHVSLCLFVSICVRSDIDSNNDVELWTSFSVGCVILLIIRYSCNVTNGFGCIALLCAAM
jgi:hypothetical protein